MKDSPISTVKTPSTRVITSWWASRVRPKYPKRAPPETRTAVKPRTKSSAPAAILLRRPPRASARSETDRLVT